MATLNNEAQPQSHHHYQMRTTRHLPVSDLSAVLIHTSFRSNLTASMKSHRYYNTASPERGCSSRYSQVLKWSALCSPVNGLMGPLLPISGCASIFDLVLYQATTSFTVFSCAKAHHPYKNSPTMPRGGITMRTDA